MVTAYFFKILTRMIYSAATFLSRRLYAVRYLNKDWIDKLVHDLSVLEVVNLRCMETNRPHHREDRQCHDEQNLT